MAFKILSLDGGGSKGVYTLGALNELEKMLGSGLHTHFDLIYGTSTGSIIGALLAMGKSVDEIKKLYFDLVPAIMKSNTPAKRSKNLEILCDKTFGEATFEMVKTGIGIVSMNYDDSKPFIFKAHVGQAYTRKATFAPGFGCTISKAVQASCAAYPFFKKKHIATANQGTITAVDGGFIANNPVFFALTDALSALQIPLQDIRVLSIGTGNFVEQSISWTTSIVKQLKFVQLFERTLKASSTTTEILVKFLYPALQLIRINESFNQPQYGTNMVEAKVSKLEMLYRLGRDSFGNQENQIKTLFQ